MQENYFRFNLYGKSWGEIKEKGNYVFQNRDNKIGVHNSLVFLVFHFVVNYNLSDLELFFRLAGFSAFTNEEMPDSVISPISPETINLTTKENVHSGWYGGIEKEEEAKKYIESELGIGIISRYQDIKKKQLAYQSIQLYEQLKKLQMEQEKLDDNYSYQLEQPSYIK